MQIFDTHAHYDDEAYKDDLEQVLKEEFNNEVKYIVNVGANVQGSLDSISLAKRYKNIYAAIGLHPEVIDDNVVESYNRIVELLESMNPYDKIVAVGEIGLDYHYIKDNKEKQKEYFLKQMELAKKYDLKVIVHCRDAAEDMYELLKNEDGMNGKIVFHCFQPDERLLKLIINKNYMAGIGGNITYKRKDSVLSIIEKLPVDNILFETDCPYLTPVPHRGEINKSHYIKYVAQTLANIKHIEVDELMEKVYNNSKKFYGI